MDSIEKKAVDVSNAEVVFGTHKALNRINFSLNSGEFLAVVGPNGGGKTTLLKLLLGLIAPDSGIVKLFGRSISNLKYNDIGYVPQMKTIDRTFPALAYELVASGITGRWIARISKADKEAAMLALSEVRAEHLAERQISRLSGGELQRVFLARSIARCPKILFLDEPSTGIDLTGESDINSMLENYRKKTNITTIMVTHDWDAALHHSDYVLLLNVNQVCFDIPSVAFSDGNIRRCFGHVGHDHDMITKHIGNMNLNHKHSNHRIDEPHSH